MVQYLIIVARDQSDLCEYLKRAFSGDEKVEIIQDRRWSNWDRPCGEEPPLERRSRWDVEHKLQMVGFAVTRRQPWPPGTDWLVSDGKACAGRPETLS